MEPTTRKTILTLWRDTAVAAGLIYFALLILNMVFNQFVQALVPLTGIGWLTIILLSGWLLLAHWTKS